MAVFILLSTNEPVPCKYNYCLLKKMHTITDTVIKQFIIVIFTLKRTGKELRVPECNPPLVKKLLRA